MACSLVWSLSACVERSCQRRSNMKEATNSPTLWIILTTMSGGQRRLPEAMGSLHPLLRWPGDLRWPWTKGQKPADRLRNFEKDPSLCSTAGIHQGWQFRHYLFRRETASVNHTWREAVFYLEITECFGYVLTFLFSR